MFSSLIALLEDLSPRFSAPFSLPLQTLSPTYLFISYVPPLPHWPPHLTPSLDLFSSASVPIIPSNTSTGP